jgi:hypothetical protein
VVFEHVQGAFGVGSRRHGKVVLQQIPYGAEYLGLIVHHQNLSILL